MQIECTSNLILKFPHYHRCDELLLESYSQISTSVYTGDLWSTPLLVITDGEYGQSSIPTFMDQVTCTSQELMLLDCPVSTQLGLIEDCACDNCVQSLAVRCPGK